MELIHGNKSKLEGQEMSRNHSVINCATDKYLDETCRSLERGDEKSLNLTMDATNIKSNFIDQQSDEKKSSNHKRSTSNVGAHPYIAEDH